MYTEPRPSTNIKHKTVAKPRNKYGTRIWYKSYCSKGSYTKKHACSSFAEEYKVEERYYTECRSDFCSRRWVANKYYPIKQYIPNTRDIKFNPYLSPNWYRSHYSEKITFKKLSRGIKSKW